MTKHALIVDDNRPLAEDLAEILLSEGYESYVFDDPQAALREAPRLAFEVALLDVRMPGMDGVSLQQQLQAVKPHVRIVLMTAYAEDKRLAEGIARGARTFTKPFVIADLLRVLAEQTDATS